MSIDLGRMSRRSVRCGLAGLICAAAGVFPALAADPAPWRFFGNDIGNTRGHISGGVNVGASFQINPSNTPKLRLKWSYTTRGDVSATPTVEAGGVYFPDYAGYLYKVNTDTGSLIWSKPLSSYMGGVFGSSRSSPAIGDQGEIVIGNNSTNTTASPGARVLSIDKTSGSLNWLAIVDTNPHSYVTSSPVIYNGIVYVGVASDEEARASSVPGFVASFRGSLVALDETSGKILWRFYTVPKGYTGAAIWSSNPTVWPKGSSLLVSTGNNYSVPAAVSSCYASAGSSVSAQYACMDPTNFVDSVVSLDLKTGRLNWARRVAGADTWNIACSKGPQSACPTPAGVDNDFAASPNLAWLPNFIGVGDDRGGASASYLLGAGQKGGNYWAINPVNGGLFWSTFLGRGQIMWGSAIDTDDHDAVYVALSNSGHYVNTLAGQNGNPTSWNAGAWASLNLRTGDYNWQVRAFGNDLANPQYGAAAPGPVTFTNRVVFAGATSGYFVGLDGTTGKTLWSYNAGGSVIGGPAVYNETLFWGAGAVKSSSSSSVRKVFAFAVPRP